MSLKGRPDEESQPTGRANRRQRRLAHRWRLNSMNMRKNRAAMVCLGCSLVAVLAWLHLGYRLWLFMVQSHYVLNDNHMAEHDFPMWYGIGTAAATIGALAFAVWRPTKMWIRCALITSVVLNIGGVWALHEFHRSGILVEYGEAHRVEMKKFQPRTPRYLSLARQNREC